MTTRSRQRKLRAVEGGGHAAVVPAGVKLEAASAEELAAMTHLTAQARLVDGREITLIVPADFGPSELEVAIGMLLETRKAVEASKGAKNTGLVAVKRPPIVGADGRPVS
jgi:hypothetical protein